MKKIYCLLAVFLSLVSNAQIVNIPDASLKTKLLAITPAGTTIYARGATGNFLQLDLNNDGEIQVSEAGLVYVLVIKQTDDITSLVGIEQFYNLREFTYGQNSGAIPSLNLQNMPYLDTVNLDDNNITNLNLSGNANLKILNAPSSNGITNLNINGSNNLVNISLPNEDISSINVQNYANLQSLVCRPQTFINVQGCINLSNLGLSGGSFNNLNLNDCVNLTSLSVSFNNAITTLDVQSNHNLLTLNCSFLPLLQNLLMKNGINETTLSFAGCPQLKYICADESQMGNVQILINNYGYTNCFVNSYCSFVPGGNYFTVKGNSKWDFNNNGCDAMDFNVQHLKFFINTISSNSGTLISDSSGNYSIPVVAGTHIITPLFENNYFIVTPSNRTVNFPADPSPVTQNFCIKPNGVHPDLEVIFIPLRVAIPGFDAKYRIILRNKGNTIQSGTVNLNFNDSLLDFVSALPVVTTQTVNNLSWNFTNLMPFDTKEIYVVLNVNSPMEIPAVNSGDVLNYTTTVTSPAIDDKPNDNTFIYNHVVVNSYDPNDKTCLQGNVVGPAKIGDYVHYVIRFENTGTFPAQNIVVKDVIDTSKFNLFTLQSLAGSHEFYTRITPNGVEFIFENINLPFDDANNDGYVAFKIKTSSSLVVGDTFSNSAKIYFDYNFPIVTNTASTTIAALNNPSVDFANYFSIYPNPTTKELNINLKQAVEINSIQIYNTIGQLVTVQIGNTLKVDVSNLKTGNYFIKINTNEGFSTSQFIKE